MNPRHVWFVLGALALGQPAVAQARFEVGVTPLIGSVDPVGALPRADLLASDLHMIVYGDIERAWSVGGAITVEDTRSPLGLRLGVMRAFGADVTGRWACKPAVDGGPAGCPSILILVPTDVSVTSASASVAGRLALGAVEVAADVGLGWVRQSYAWQVAADDPFSLEPGAATRSGATVHGGLETRVRVSALPRGRLVVRYEEARAFSDDPGRPSRWRNVGAGVALGLFR